MKLTRFLWSHRKAVLTLTLLLCVLGGYFALHLPVAIFPQLVVPRVAVSADAGDIPLETTLAQVTRPLEAAVSTVPGVTKVQSVTSRGSDSLDVTFAWGTDMQLALQRVQGQISDTRPTLPAGANVTAEVINPSIFPIMGYSLTSKTVDLAELRRLANYTIRPRLARLPGVAQIRITGGDAPEFLVAVEPRALAAHGLTLQDVQDAIAKANGVSSVGQINHAYQRYEILVSGLLRNEDDVRAVTVAAKNGVPIAVSDIATVSRSVQPRTILATGNGSPAVIVNVIKQPDANTVQVADEVHAALADLRSTLPAGVDTSLFYDQSEIVKSSESSVIESIVIGGILALIVLTLFLGNIRAASIVLIILPLSILITFGLMKALGQTLNIMTLGALAIALGLVIDDGIVVVENIFHEREMGRSRRAAIAAGIQAITPAMVGSSLTTMAAFLPLTFLSGVTGQFFGPLALVMVATLFVSLVLALCLTPLLADVLLPRDAEKKDGEAHKPSLPVRIMERVAERYSRILTWCLRKPVVVLGLLVPVVFGAWLLFNHLQTGFFPEFDEGAFVVDYRLPPGTSLVETDRVAREIETILGKTPEVAAWSRLTGALSGSGLELAEQSQGDILVRLKTDRTRSADDIMTDLREQIGGKFPQAEGDYIQILQDGIGDMAGSPKAIEVKIFGDDPAKLADLAHAAGDIVTRTPGVVDENDGVVESGPELIAHVDSAQAARYGLTTEAVTSAVTTAMAGSIATRVQQGEEGIDVRVQATRKGAPLDPALLPGVAIATPSGATVPLSAVASIEAAAGTPQITRENQLPMVAVTAGLEGRDLGSAVHDVQSRLAKGLHLPPGYRIEYGGLYASQQDSFLQLAAVLATAVLAVTALLIVQLRSFRQTFSLLIAAIVSLSGVLLGLYITSTPLNISSFTGAVMIVGIVTENGIVLFDFFNHLQKLGPDRPNIDVMIEAARMRLRPILMTTVGAILALLPLALGLGAGAAMQRPLAIAVIGGLTVSTLFTLIVAPVLFIATHPGRLKPAADSNDEFSRIEQELAH
ncbi:multidrug ABC transporter [Capsulimonas corticalis]|uniref:Multidrug ABC transporter n=1 Tax=Capsulimonas corticalis TaxID=2219043 RepID=A0A402CVE4_9BACT|nr:efflux RND transporter permease subunit [Capsulimonas corticalis]BDI30375.1 multidrug ABC transporter [Capsulimonas corticalis]